MSPAMLQLIEAIARCAWEDWRDAKRPDDATAANDEQAEVEKLPPERPAA